MPCKLVRGLERLALGRNIRLLAGVAVSTFVLGLVPVAGYVLASQDIEDLLLCADRGGLVMPFSRGLCRQYLFASRGTPGDIADLQRGIGASFAVQGLSSVEEREQVLRFLLRQGLNVDAVDMHGYTALHGAVLANAPDEVAMLLRNGADPTLRDRRSGLTPLELAGTLRIRPHEQQQASRVRLLLQ